MRQAGRPAGQGSADCARKSLVGYRCVGHPIRGPGFIGAAGNWARLTKEAAMIRKLASGEYRLYSRKLDPRTGKRRNLGTFASRAAAEKHEREVQYFKRH
jgi:hypothetical protein